MHTFFNKNKSLPREAKRSGGFTLVELMVVVAIIGVLLSVVTASLSSSRKKAKDSAVKVAAAQMAGLMAMNFDQYGDYCNLQGQRWVTASNITCDTIEFSGNYANQAKALCKDMYNNSNIPSSPGPTYRVYFGTDGAFGCSKAFSVMAFLNSSKWYCVGSSGRKGEYSSYKGSAGCYNNP